MKVCVECKEPYQRGSRHGYCRQCCSARAESNAAMSKLFVEDARQLGWDAHALLNGHGAGMRPVSNASAEVILGGGCVLVMECGYVVHRYVKHPVHGECFPRVGVTQDRALAVRALAKLAVEEANDD